MFDRHAVYGYALLNRGAARFRHERRLALSGALPGSQQPDALSLSS